MSPTSTHRLYLFVTLLAFLPTAATAAVIYQDVAELTAQARQIVIGDVIAVASGWNADHTLIRSRITVNVDTYLVGTGSGVEIVEMSGGTVGDTTLFVSALPTFQEGDHVLLFLGDTQTRLVGCFQGAYLTDGRDAGRMAPACQRFIPESVESLSSLLGKVQRALPAGTVLPAIPLYAGDFRLPSAVNRYSLCGANWNYNSCPMGENYVINANCADGSAGDAESQRTQIQNGPAAWNSAGAEFQFTYGGTSTLTSVSYNNINLVYFDTTPPDGGGYVAATYYWTSGSNITEIDLVFNDQEYTWWNGSGSCSYKMDIWNIAAHEYGHWLCLADLYGGGDYQKTMYGYVDYCETLKRSLHTDDINGILGIYGTHESTPPSPDPMTWATAPAPTSITAVTMTATTATDATTPVQYFFHFVSGGSGGNDSTWQTGTTFNDSGLTANTAYTYQVMARDGACPQNETAYSAEAATATYIQTPTGVTIGTVTSSTIDLVAAGTLTNLTVGSSGVYFDSTTTGGDGGVNEWVQTTTDTATGLSPNKSYAFRVKARNQNSIETAYTTAVSQVTLANVPAAPTLSNPTQTTMLLDVNANGNPTSTQFAIQCTATTDSAWNGKYVSAAGQPVSSAVWQMDSVWGTLTLLSMQSATAYSFAVKARNSDNIETAFGPAATLSTLGVTTGACCFHNGTCQQLTDTACTAAGGESWTANQSCTPNLCEQPVGACCFHDGTCQQLTEAACTAAGGEVWTMDQSCTPNPCEQPVGACCFHDGTCQQLTEAACTATGGEVWTMDQSCTPNPCEQPVGACCFHDGTCQQLTDVGCTTAGGETWTMDQSCTPNLCTQPTGACCFHDGTCQQLTEVACTTAGGETWTMDQSCTPNLCTQPVGACCFHDGTCQQLTEVACTTAGGETWTMDQSCTPNLCTQPTGACCFHDGTCQQLTEVACTTAGGETWTMDQSCTPNPCTQPVGACCFHDGTCQQLTEAACTTAGGETWTMDLACDPNPCTQPVGACCFHDGTCQQLTEAACTTAGGETWTMDQSCTPNLCTQPVGACCFHDGTCQQLTEAACTTAGGEIWTMDQSCTPNLCMQPVGACCFHDGTCQQLTEAACTTAGGEIWTMDLACDPNPCAQPTGACCFEDGHCEVLTAAACAAAAGTYDGNDTVCDPNPCPQPLLHGDLNCDGLVSFADINPFVLALSNPEVYAQTYPDCDILAGDMNCDGSTGFQDINPFVNCLSNGDCDCP